MNPGVDDILRSAATMALGLLNEMHEHVTGCREVCTMRTDFCATLSYLQRAVKMAEDV